MSVVASGGISRVFRWALSAVCDACLAAASFAFGLLLVFNGDRSAEFDMAAEQLRQIAPLFVAIYILLFIIGGVYASMWRYAGFAEAVRLIAVTAVAMIIEIALSYMFRLKLPLDIHFLSAILICVSTLAARFVGKLLRELSSSRARDSVEKRSGGRVMIVGAGDGGRLAVKLCRERLGVTGEPVCFVDDDIKKHDMRIDGVPVLGTTEDLPKLVKRRGITELVIAMPGVKGERIERVIESCRMTRLPVRLLSEIGGAGGRIRELTLADFLSRPEPHINENAASDCIKNSVILIVGGGDIGADICRQALKFAPDKLVVMDNDETRVSRLLSSIRLSGGDVSRVVTVVGSVRDRARICEVLDAYEPGIVFHTATLTNEPIMEGSPAEAIKTNIFGTQNLLDECEAHNVERFALISSDKAVNPVSVVGATMRAAEMLVCQRASEGKLRAFTLRAGDILGASGGLISLIDAQIMIGGPVTITDPEVTRYFISSQEVARLALHAVAMSERGAIYVLNMGDPVRVIDIVKKLIRFHGFTAGVDMPIDVTGLLPGEKLTGELVTGEERARMSVTANDRIMIAPTPPQNDLKLDMQIEKLRRVASYNDDAVLGVLMDVVKTYKPSRITLVS